MEWFLDLITSVVEELIVAAIVAAILAALAILRAGPERIQQAWREHRVAVPILAVATVGLIAMIVFAVWLSSEREPSPTERRQLLAEALFAGPDDLESGVTYRDLDLFGSQISGRGSDCDGYEGGHGAWHVRAVKAESDGVRDDLPFYSLTEGVVVELNASGTYNEIAIAVTENEVEVGYTVIYAHASDHKVGTGAEVQVGHKLGIQGREGLADDDVAAVHVEVREYDKDGKQRVNPACGAAPTDGAPSPINPTEFLYGYLFGD